VHGRDFARDDHDVTGFMHAQLFAAFQEDIEALTRLEKVLADPGDPYFEISVASDQPSIAMRRYLRKRALADTRPLMAGDGIEQAISAAVEGP
jgi:vanillate O-demethylase monooxygenase subunit